MAAGADQEAQIKAALQVTRMVAASFFMGVALVYGLAVALIYGNPDKPGSQTSPPVPLSAIGVGLAVLLTAGSFVAKGVLLKSARAQAEKTGKSLTALLAGYRVAVLVTLALCEAGAFLIAVFVLVAGPEQKAWLIAGLLPVLGMALHFPSRTGFDQLAADLGSPR